ncbi:MAG: 16S rRNA (guanine(527)-N(7))-methyltransferase RsmG [Armatimonadota bacterium]|nr:16S rRNA (guanine(527)-N(7))-methyltransferase RsmG [Armatimonadota bacterium]
MNGEGDGRDTRAAVNAIRDGAEGLGILLSDEELERYRLYLETLQEWNQRMNLTAARDPLELAVKHFLDSLTCFLVTAADTPLRVLDVGTGAGFPGVVLKIHAPQWHLTLLDSTRKKVAFLEHLVGLLGLQQTDTLHARAEEAGRLPAYRERFDLVVARAVAELRVLAEWCLPFVRVGGLFVAMKGPRGDEEAPAAKSAVAQLGGEIEQVKPLVLPFGAGERRLVLVRKRRPTPRAFPRAAGAAARRPL